MPESHAGTSGADRSNDSLCYYSVRPERNGVESKDRSSGIPSACRRDVAGLLRVFHFEKGASYYFHSIPFIAKLSLFVAVALLSMYPTVQFLSWGPALKKGNAPVVDARTLRAIRAVVHFELAGDVCVILFAALMARGAGYAG